MHGRFARLMVVGAASTWGACSTFGSGNDDGVATADAATDTAVEGSEPSDASQTPDRASSDAFADASLPDGTLLVDTFENGTAVCQGWSARAGATAFRVADAGAGPGIGYCQLCGPQNSVMLRNVTLIGSGQLDALAVTKQSETDAAALVSLTLFAVYLDGGPAGSGNTSVPPLATWAPIQTDAPLMPGAATASIRVGISSAGGCVLVDDVSVNQE